MTVSLDPMSTSNALAHPAPPEAQGASAARKVFWEDPYRTVLSTQVKRALGSEVTLAETIFYAFSGGQESDEGTIGGLPVLAARKEGLDIVYRLPEGHALTSGDEVEVRIDWDRRYALMRLHFAAEVVLELIYRYRPGVRKIGAHISATKARIDFEWQGSIAEALPELTRQARDIVASNAAITSAYSDRERQRRFWKIDAFAAVPCGGTHLRTTGETGVIELRRRNIGKGKERIEITLASDGNPQSDAGAGALPEAANATEKGDGRDGSRSNA